MRLCRGIRGSVLFLLFIGITIFSVPPAMAFKADTHVWIAQQVINDLADGKITIPNNADPTHPFTFDIDASIKDSILNNQSIYRMGNIGPDASPDIFTGQMVVHPGQSTSTDPTDWQADDWLKFLLDSKDMKLITPVDEKLKDGTFECQANNIDCKNPTVIGDMTEQEKAYVYGYFGHAAGDVFAHSYINEYAGNIFDIGTDLKAGQSPSDATVEEVRHFELESYIASYTPPLRYTDVETGLYVGAPADVVAFPVEFMRNRLIFNDVAAERNKKGGATHLALIHELRKYLVANGNTAFDNGEKITAYALVYYYSNGNIKLTDAQAAKLVKYVKELHQLTNKYNGIDQTQAAVTGFFNAMVGVVDFSADVQASLDQAFVDVVTNTAALDAAEQAVSDALTTLNNTAQTLCHQLCPPAPPCPAKGLCPPAPPCDLICDLNPAYTAAQLALDAAKKVRDAANTQLQNAVTQKAKVINDINTIVTTALSIPLTIFNSSLDTLQAVTTDINPFRSARDQWIKDLELGMDAWITANADVIRNAMAHKSATDAFAPINDWMSCWLPAITTPVPSQTTIGACTVQNQLDAITAAFGKLKTDVIAIDPVAKAVQDWFDKLMADLTQRATEVALDWTAKTVKDGEAIVSIVNMVTQPPSDALLTQIFSVDLSSNKSKGLLEFPDIVQRIQGEMHVKARPAVWAPCGKVCPTAPIPQANSQEFDSELFAPIRDAVTLAKLTLLTPKQLNELIQLNTVTAIGRDIYTNITETRPGQILIGAIRSLDGNQQWGHIAPDYPRRPGFENLGKATAAYPHEYGYEATPNSNKGGFKLWNDCDARSTFRNIFIGPLNPGITIPGYDQSATDPFPQWTVVTNLGTIPGTTQCP